MSLTVLLTIQSSVTHSVNHSVLCLHVDLMMIRTSITCVNKRLMHGRQTCRPSREEDLSAAFVTPGSPSSCPLTSGFICSSPGLCEALSVYLPLYISMLSSSSVSVTLYISVSITLYLSVLRYIYSYIYVHTTFYPYLPLPSLPVVLFISSLSPDLSLSLSLSLISSSLRLSSCPQGSLSRFRSPLPSSIFPLR